MSDEVLCIHCSEPVPARRVSPGADNFCCPGCEAVHYALGEAGLGDFYRYSDLPIGACPAPGSIRPGAIEQIDYTRHIETLPDATHKLVVHLEGVHCAGCVWLVEQMPGSVDGVLESRLEIARARLTVRWEPGRVELDAILGWLAAFGYTAYPEGQGEATGLSEQDRALLRRVGVTWALAGNISLLAAAQYSGLNMLDAPFMASAASALSLGLATVGMMYGADVFLRRAWLSLRTLGSGPLSMDVPLSIGILMGWGYSAWATWSGAGEVWFDSLMMLTAALLTARWVQQRASHHARAATARLLSLLPQVARRVDPATGEVSQVALETLEPGDLIEVRMGDVVPADGVILTGRSAMHRGVLTGESRPERAVPGDAVEAGSTNLEAPLRVEVLQRGEDTRVGQLMGWIEERAGARAVRPQAADKLGVWFVLGVLVAATLTGLFWAWAAPALAMSHVIAVLVVSCPCALSMATPLTLAVFVGRAARHGLFIKHDDVVEALSEITHVVLDKTGTLTRGEMRVVAWSGSRDAIALAAALEASSAHPIAAAIARHGEDALEARRWDIEEVEERAGMGIRGVVGGHSVFVGKPEDLNPVRQETLEAWAAAGHTPVVVVVDGHVSAMLAIGDPIKPDALCVLEDLRDRGIETVLLSGDHPMAVAHVGEALGFAQVHGGASPERKLEVIESLCGPETRVMMIGDGVNDAAAMQAADVGVAVHGSVQASLVAADVFATTESLQSVTALLDGSTRAVRVIRRSLWGSALYNMTMIVLASAGWISPLVAAIVMPLSSLSVVAASWASRTFEDRSETQENTELAPTAWPGHEEWI